MRRLLFLFSLVVLMTGAAAADTIHLKNGSVLKGKVTSFADDQFTVMIDTGSGRYLSHATVYVGDVARVEFDGPTSGSPDSATRDNEAVKEPQQTTVSGPPPSQQPDTQPTDQPRDSASQPKEVISTTTEPEPSAAPPLSAAPAPEPETEKSGRKPIIVRTLTVDVVGKRDWTSSGLIVKRGDRIRIAATGTVTLDPVSGQVSGPEGVADLADPKKLMADQPSGALIGVIGADNDDFIFIGKASEFTAARDGLLFLSVNEGTLSDNSGTYRATIDLLATRKPQQ